MRVLDVCRSISDNALLGEAYFIAAKGYSTIGLFNEAKEFYLKSYQNLKKAHLMKKAIKALQNHIVVESKIKPQKSLFSDYNFLFKESLRVGNKPMAGLAKQNISREYELVGSLDIALEYAEQSVELMSDDSGSFHYFMAILHKAHLLVKLKMFEEAKKEIQRLGIAKFQEIQEGLKVLNGEITREKVKIDRSKLVPTWRERLDEFSMNRGNKIRLSKTEEKLIQFLESGPKKKAEILDYMYSNSGDFFSVENRFKVLLSRFRKKCADIIIFENDRYRINLGDSLHYSWPEKECMGF